MNRLFGIQRPRLPVDTLEETVKTVDTRLQECETKVRQCDAELQKALQRIKQQEKYSSNIGTSSSAVRTRALALLRQKKLYEERLTQLQMQQMNMEQAIWATTQARATQQTVAALKHANRELRRCPMRIDEIERLQDSVADALVENDEIQRVLARSYDLDGIDEATLDAELDALGELDELDSLEQIESAGQIKNDEIPSYLKSVPLEASEIESNLKDLETAIPDR